MTAQQHQTHLYSFQKVMKSAQMVLDRIVSSPRLSNWTSVSSFLCCVLSLLKSLVHQLSFLFLFSRAVMFSVASSCLPALPLKLHSISPERWCFVEHLQAERFITAICSFTFFCISLSICPSLSHTHGLLLLFTCFCPSPSLFLIYLYICLPHEAWQCPLFHSLSFSLSILARRHNWCNDYCRQSVKVESLPRHPQLSQAVKADSFFLVILVKVRAFASPAQWQVTAHRAQRWLKVTDLIGNTQ